MEEPSAKVIEELHARLRTLEERVASRATIVTGVQGVRIMRVVALMSGDPFRYELVRPKGSKRRRWC